MNQIIQNILNNSSFDAQTKEGLIEVARYFERNRESINQAQKTVEVDV